VHHAVFDRGGLTHQRSHEIMRDIYERAATIAKSMVELHREQEATARAAFWNSGANVFRKRAQHYNALVYYCQCKLWTARAKEMQKSTR
jgi:hypothetical protein